MRPIRPTASGVRAASHLIDPGAQEGLRLPMLLALVSLSRLLAKTLPDAGDAVGGRRKSINDAAEPGAT